MSLAFQLESQCRWPSSSKANVAGLPARKPMSLAFQLESQCRWPSSSEANVAGLPAPEAKFRHGDDVAPVRERRGTTPLAHIRVRRSSAGDDGPTRSALLGWLSCSSESSPVMAGSVLLTTILVPGAGHPVSVPLWPSH
jgi:hypothetical protein